MSIPDVPYNYRAEGLSLTPTPAPSAPESPKTPQASTPDQSIPLSKWQWVKLKLGIATKEFMEAENQADSRITRLNALADKISQFVPRIRGQRASDLNTQEIQTLENLAKISRTIKEDVAAVRKFHKSSLTTLLKNSQIRQALTQAKNYQLGNTVTALQKELHTSEELKKTLDQLTPCLEVIEDHFNHLNDAIARATGLLHHGTEFYKRKAEAAYAHLIAAGDAKSSNNLQEMGEHLKKAQEMYSSLKEGHNFRKQIVENDTAKRAFEPTSSSESQAMTARRERFEHLDKEYMKPLEKALSKKLKQFDFDLNTVQKDLLDKITNKSTIPDMSTFRAHDPVVVKGVLITQALATFDSGKTFEILGKIAALDIRFSAAKNEPLTSYVTNPLEELYNQKYRDIGQVSHAINVGNRLLDNFSHIPKTILASQLPIIQKDLYTLRSKIEGSIEKYKKSLHENEKDRPISAHENQLNELSLKKIGQALKKIAEFSKDHSALMETQTLTAEEEAILKLDIEEEYSAAGRLAKIIPEEWADMGLSYEQAQAYYFPYPKEIVKHYQELLFKLDGNPKILPLIDFLKKKANLRFLEQLKHQSQGSNKFIQVDFLVEQIMARNSPSSVSVEAESKEKRGRADQDLKIRASVHDRLGSDLPTEERSMLKRLEAQRENQQIFGSSTLPKDAHSIKIYEKIFIHLIDSATYPAKARQLAVFLQMYHPTILTALLKNAYIYDALDQNNMFSGSSKLDFSPSLSLFMKLHQILNSPGEPGIISEAHESLVQEICQLKEEALKDPGNLDLQEQYQTVERQYHEAVKKYGLRSLTLPQQKIITVLGTPRDREIEQLQGNMPRIKEELKNLRKLLIIKIKLPSTAEEKVFSLSCLRQLHTEFPEELSEELSEEIKPALPEEHREPRTLIDARTDFFNSRRAMPTLKIEEIERLAATEPVLFLEQVAALCLSNPALIPSIKSTFGKQIARLKSSNEEKIQYLLREINFFDEIHAISISKKPVDLNKLVKLKIELDHLTKNLEKEEERDVGLIGAMHFFRQQLHDLTLRNGYFRLTDKEQTVLNVFMQNSSAVSDKKIAEILAKLQLRAIGDIALTASEKVNLLADIDQIQHKLRRSDHRAAQSEAGAKVIKWHRRSAFRSRLSPLGDPERRRTLFKDFRVFLEKSDPHLKAAARIEKELRRINPSAMIHLHLRRTAVALNDDQKALIEKNLKIIEALQAEARTLGPEYAQLMRQRLDNYKNALQGLPLEKEEAPKEIRKVQEREGERKMKRETEREIKAESEKISFPTDSEKFFTQKTKLKPVSREGMEWFLPQPEEKERKEKGST